MQLKNLSGDDVVVRIRTEENDTAKYILKCNQLRFSLWNQQIESITTGTEEEGKTYFSVDEKHLYIFHFFNFLLIKIKCFSRLEG